jgi:hypothetical protein
LYIDIPALSELVGFKPHNWSRPYGGAERKTWLHLTTEAVTLAHRTKGFSHRDDFVRTRQRGQSAPPGNTGNGKLKVRTRTSLKERVTEIMDENLEDPEALLENDIE